jgi:hypothetical protein
MFPLVDRLRCASLATRRGLRTAYDKVYKLASFTHMVALVEVGLPIWAHLHHFAKRRRERREKRRARRRSKAPFHAKASTSSAGPPTKLLLLLHKRRAVQRLK